MAKNLPIQDDLVSNAAKVLLESETTSLGKEIAEARAEIGKIKFERDAAIAQYDALVSELCSSEIKVILNKYSRCLKQITDDQWTVAKR